MKKHLTKLFIAVFLLCSSAAFAAPWTIRINNTVGLNTLCFNNGVFYTNVTLDLYDPSGNKQTGSASFYCSQQLAIIPTNSATMPNGTPAYVLQTPTYIPSTGLGTGSFYGTATIYAFVGSTLETTLVVTFIPYGIVIPNAISGTTSITTTGTYSLNTPTTAFVNYPATWSLSNPQYTIGGTNFPVHYTSYVSGNYFYITPNNEAPLFGGVMVNAGFTPTGSTCGADAGATPYHGIGRVPAIASSSAPLNILCSGASSVLSLSNVVDMSTYPSIPSDNGLTHFTYQWYNSAGVISGATNSTYTATATGSYYVKVTQYSQLYGGGTSWSWSTTADGTATSNTIVLSTAPGGTITPGFTINGTTPPTSASGSLTNYFYCNAITFANTSTVSGGDVIHTYELDILNSTGTVVWSQSSSSSAPPASFDLSTAFQTIGQAGTYGIKLTEGNGCQNAAPVEGFIKVSGAPSATLLTTAYTTSYSQVSYTGGLSIIGGTPGYLFAPPSPIGRNGTVFIPSPSYVSGATICSFQPSLYHVIEEVQISTGVTRYLTVNIGTDVPFWTGNTVTENCTSPTIPNIPIALVGPSGYFGSASTAPDGSAYYIDFAIVNNCGVTHVGQYFMMDDVDYLRGVNPNLGVNNTIKNTDVVNFYPVPFTNQITANITADETANASLVIYTVDGRTVASVMENENVVQGQTTKTINTVNWAAGVYFYKLSLNGKIYSGKIVK